MGVQFPNPLKNPILFPHSNKFSQGLGKTRMGAGEVVLALDGTGDFDSLFNAIAFVEDLGGGVIRLKNGTYLSASLNSKSNITFIGDGKNFTTISVATQLNLSNSAKITFENLQIKGTSVASQEAILDVDSATNLTIKDCLIEEGAGADYDGAIWNSGGGTISNLRILNTEFKGSFTECTLPLVMENAQIIGCKTNDDLFRNNDTNEIRKSIITNCIIGGDIKIDSAIKSIISNNYVAGDILIDSDSPIATANAGHFNIISNNFMENTITMNVGADQNVVSGNQTDTATVNNGAGNIFSGHNEY